MSDISKPAAQAGASEKSRGVPSGGGMFFGREPVLRVIPEPADLNYNGHIFGGWVLSMMDRAGGIIARGVARKPVATIAIDKMEFIEPILLRDLVTVYGVVERIGSSSIIIRLDVIASRDNGDTETKVTTGRYTFVALNDQQRPSPIDPAHKQAWEKLMGEMGAGA